MRSGNTYRFSLQFGADTESRIRAGEFMERLGNKKSAVVVTALNEYLEKHPELENESLRITIEERNQMRRSQLEEVIRRIVSEQLSANASPSPASSVPAVPPQDTLQQDIAAMLDNLDFFQ